MANDEELRRTAQQRGFTGAAPVNSSGVTMQTILGPRTTAINPTNPDGTPFNGDIVDSNGVSQDYKVNGQNRVPPGMGQSGTPGFEAANGNQPASIAQQWQAAPNPAPPIQQQVVDTMGQQTGIDHTKNWARDEELYNNLLRRSQQSLNVGANDPAVKAQTDAYRDEQTRAGRDFLADTAEEQGPYGDMRSEQRLTAETVGSNVGRFQAELQSREMQARREEIQAAIDLMASTGQADKQRELQRQLGLLDQSIAQQQLGLQTRGLDQDLLGQRTQEDQFNRDLALRAEDRSSYYDAVRRGLFRPE